jgi:hypothetical protein
LYYNQRPLPSGSFLDVVAGDHGQFAVIRSDGSGASYFADRVALRSENPGPLKQLSGSVLGLNLAVDGTIVPSSATVPTGTFTDLSYGVIDDDRWGYCGVGSGGALSCWSSYGTETPPVTGSVRQTTLSAKNGCAVREDGTLACWGQNRLGQATAPSGAFVQVSRGPNHGCAIRVDGTVACWGRNDDGEATPPAGRFVQVSARGAHTCGIRTNGELSCWGANGSGQASPPEGKYLRVSAGGLRSCAIATDQSLVCWGERRESYGILRTDGEVSQ